MLSYLESVLMIISSSNADKKHLLVVVGSTASGKTDFAIELARHYQTEIVSCDAKQFYKEMHIGTAMPTPAERASATHHFIDFLPLEASYNAGVFTQEARPLLDRLFKHSSYVVLVGGSGLYRQALCEGLDEMPFIDPLHRQKLNLLLQKEGLKPLLDHLQKVDPTYYQMVDTNNPQRVIRALEVFIATGLPYSSFRKKKVSALPYHIIKVGRSYARDQLYKRINDRVDKMMELGLLEEVKQLYSRRHSPALQAIGYTELFQYLEDKISLEEAIAKIKQHTRNYAKRQLTWLNKEPDIKWFEGNFNLGEVHNYIDLHS